MTKKHTTLYDQVVSAMGVDSPKREVDICTYSIDNRLNKYIGDINTNGYTETDIKIKLFAGIAFPHLSQTMRSSMIIHLSNLYEMDEEEHKEWLEDAINIVGIDVDKFTQVLLYDVLVDDSTANVFTFSPQLVKHK